MYVYDCVSWFYIGCYLYQIPGKVSLSQIFHVFLGVPTLDSLQAVGTSPPQKKDHGRNHDTMDRRQEFRRELAKVQAVETQAEWYTTI